jgi:hypothetical protein
VLAFGIIEKNMISHAHPCKGIFVDDDFGGLLSHSLYSRRRWDVDGLFATRVRDRAYLEEPSLSILIGNQKEGEGQRTETVAPLELETDE